MNKLLVVCTVHSLIMFKPWLTMAMSSTDVITWGFREQGEMEEWNTLLIQFTFAASLYVGKIQSKRKKIKEKHWFLSFIFKDLRYMWSLSPWKAMHCLIESLIVSVCFAMSSSPSVNNVVLIAQILISMWMGYRKICVQALDVLRKE